MKTTQEVLSAHAAQKQEADQERGLLWKLLAVQRFKHFGSSQEAGDTLISRGLIAEVGPGIYAVTDAGQDYIKTQVSYSPEY